MVSIGDQLELKRSDLLNFPKDTVDLILEMQKDGWRGHRNSQGHVKMLAPDGKTHVMATSNKNSATYVRSGYNQYKKKHGEKKVNSSSQKVVQKWPCARPGCPKVYASEQQLSDHIMVDHEKKLLCPEKDCHEVRDTKQKLSIHMTHAHGYVSPRKAQRKQQEANRAKKKLNEEGKLTDEQRDAVNAYLTTSPEMEPLLKPDETAAAIIEAGKFLEGADESTGRIIDSIPVEHLVPQEGKTSLKDLARGPMLDEFPEFTATNEQPVFVQYSEGQIQTAEEIYRHTRNQLNTIQRVTQRPAVPQEVTLNLEDIMDMDIRTVARVLHAAGMKLTLSSTPIKENE